MTTFSEIYKQMRSGQRTPVQQPAQQIVEQPAAAPGEFDYAAETATEESRLITAPGKVALIPEDTQGVAPMTAPSAAVFEARAFHSIPRPDIPPLVESDVSRYLKKKPLPMPVTPAVIKEDTDPPATEYEDSKQVLANGKVQPNIDDSKFQPKFKSVREYVTFSRNKRAQYQSKIIDNA
jgi:hypothetical protein